MSQQHIVDIDGDPIDHEFEVLLKPKDAARLLCINPTTLSKWAKSGKIRSVPTLGGHRRYPADAVRCAARGDWENARVRRPRSEMSEADILVALDR